MIVQCDDAFIANAYLERYDFSGRRSAKLSAKWRIWKKSSIRYAVRHFGVLALGAAPRHAKMLGLQYRGKPSGETHESRRAAPYLTASPRLTRHDRIHQP